MENFVYYNTIFLVTNFIKQSCDTLILYYDKMLLQESIKGVTVYVE